MSAQGPTPLPPVPGGAGALAADAGILTFGKTEGVNFAVPMNTIQEFVHQAGANPGFPANSVSRQHCWIGPDAAGRVTQVELHPGDVVHLGGEGGIVFQFEA